MSLNPFKRYRINSVFFFGFAIIITILIGVVTYISYRESTAEITEKVSYYQQRLLNELNKKIAANLVFIERTAITASKNAGVLFDRLQEGDSYDRKRIQDEIHSQLSNFVFSTPILQSIHFYSNYPFKADYHEFVNFRTMEQAENQDWYDSIKNTDSAWIGEHMIESVQGQTPVISFALKTYSNSGKYDALIVMNVKVSSFHSLLSTKDDQSSTALLDGTGKPMIHIGYDKLDALTLAGMNGTLPGKDGSFRRGDDFVVWSTSSDTNWTLVEITPWEELTEGTNRLTRLLILAGFTSLLLGLAIILFMSRQFTRPIATLLRAMSQFSLKSHSVIPRDYRNEFGGLFNGFEKMVARIEELYVSLEENHKRKTAAEIRSMQTMINPHFLYNTLDQINWVAIENDQHRISSMLSHLADMFRMTLKNSGSFISVADELAHIESYLQFQVIRWENRLTYAIRVEPGCEMLMMPRFILQPFIENAFVHGFHGRSNANLEVIVAVRSGQLFIEIGDDGNGIGTGGVLPGYSGREGGHGLYNIAERIEAMFDKEYGFELMLNPGGPGTLVVIRLPVVTKEDTLDDGK